MDNPVKWQFANANSDGNWSTWKPWPAMFADGRTPIPFGDTDGGYRKWRQVEVDPPHTRHTQSNDGFPPQ